MTFAILPKHRGYTTVWTQFRLYFMKVVVTIARRDLFLSPVRTTGCTDFREM